LGGGKGNDRFFGGNGNDKLLGNEGKDTFAIQLASGKDTIVDFQDGIDRLGLSKGLTFNKLTIADNTNDTGTFIKDNNNHVLAVLVGVDSSLITQADFVLL
jgi:large repetitive protein